jgi:hypothetical protein
MVRRVENVDVFYRRDFWGLICRRYNLLLQVGKKQFTIPPRMTVVEFRQRVAESESRPVAFGRVGDRVYWRYAGRWFIDNEGLNDQAVRALLVTRDQRRGDQINRAMTMAAAPAQRSKPVRGAIAPDIRQLVWQRDGGRCVTCGGTAELQFDHVIPLSMGGGSTEHNLQVLCGPCNRRKAASV